MRNITFLLLLMIMVSSSMIAAVSAGTFNITEELNAIPDLSEFNTALTETGLASSINARNSLTVCALTNTQMSSLRSALGHDASDPEKVAALIRPLILLTFIDPTDPNTARSINGDQQVATMYQAAGGAKTEEGIANLTTTRSGQLQIVTVGGSNATITKSVKLIAYNLSIVEVSNFLKPAGVLGDYPPPPPAAPLLDSGSSPGRKSDATSPESSDSSDEKPGKSHASGSIMASSAWISLAAAFAAALFFYLV